jgi:hypothetical protein
MGRLARISAASAAIFALLAASSPAAVSSGNYKGKIKFQGYEIKFKVKGDKISNISARMLTECDGDGSYETFLIAPKGSWKIKGNRFSGKKTDTYGQSKATVVFKGKFSGGKVTGSIREWDYVNGNGIVCDTLVRKFTAKRG